MRDRDMQGKTMLEIAPPLKRASKENLNKTLEKTAQLISEAGIDVVNVPEIVTENHNGEPLYRNLDAREFAVQIRDLTKTDVAVNKVTVHLTEVEFDNWLDETVNQHKITNLIFVGGSKTRGYRGITVTAANQKAKQKNAKVGNILIPNRKNELEKLVEKTKSGASFFTTQILFEENTISKLWLDYLKTCKQQCIPPAEVYIGVAPIRDALDLEFVKWLGAEIPAAREEQLKKNYAESIKLASEVYLKIAGQINSTISLNVEPITMQNLPLALQILKTVKEKV